MTRPTRRQFLAASAAVAVAARLTAADPKPPRVAVQAYPWDTFRGRAKQPAFDADLAAGAADVAKCGADGFEPFGRSPEYLKTLAAELGERDLAVRSVYVNSKLHDPADAAASIKQVLAVADAARPLGCAVVVTNPEPLRWGGPDDKTDAQLEEQARNLGLLGKELAGRGLTLAYHNHDAEMRRSAREFHHMLAGTDPKHVSLCLDAHWVFRGSGDSQVCLFDVVRLYANRVVELHLRQSEKGVWTEAFGPGDVDYPRLARELRDRGVKPLLVLEQAVEAKTPNTLSAVEAHARGLAYAREVFARFPG